MGVHSRRAQRSWLVEVVTERAVWPVAVLVVLAVLAVVVVTVFTPLSSVTPTEPVATAMPTPRDPTSTPQARALLGELYREGVGPGSLSPESAVLVAQGVCQQRAAGKTLTAMTGAVRDALRQLSPMQGHRFVDLSVKYYCGRW